MTALAALRRSARPGAGVPLVVCLLLVAGATVVITMLVTGSAPESDAQLRDAGLLTDWLVPLTRVLLDLCTFATVGCLMVAAWLLPTSGQDSPPARRVLRLASRWSLAWAVAAILHLVTSTAQLVGEGVRSLLGTPALYRLAWELPQNRALLLIAVAGVAVALARTRVARPGSALLLLVGAVSALVPLLATGHAGSASNHYLAAQSLVVHVIAASLWVGGLMVLGLHLRKDADVMAVALPRFSRLALGCFVAVALSGILGAWVRLGFSWDTWTSTYGGLVLAKSGALVVLGLLGVAHRRWSVPQVVGGARHAFARLAAVELLVMTVAAALAVVLSRTSPPAEALTRAAPPHANSFPTVERSIRPAGLWTLLTESRLDSFVLTLACVVLVGYLVAVRAVLRRGEPWPLRRTGCFAAGVLLGGWATVGGLGAYSGALFSAEVARLLTLGLVVPALLTSGAPFTLVRLLGGSSPASSRLARWVSPVNGVALLVVVLAAALMTPLLEVSLRSPVLHLALAGVTLAAGFLFAWPLLGVDEPPAGRQDAGDGALLVGVLAILLLVQGAHIWTSSTLFADQWYGRLNWSWGNPRADQRVAGLVAAGFGVALLVAAPFVGRRRTTHHGSVSPAPARPEDRAVH